MVTKEQKIKEKTFLLCDTLIKKNKDYGNSFEKLFNKHGLMYSCIHLEEKLNRIESLAENNLESKVENESIKDSLLDIAGYAILTLISLNDNED